VACKICRHSKHAQMVIAYAYIGSFRTVAGMYGVSFKTLQRHITECVYSVISEVEEQNYQRYLKYVSEMLTWEYMPPQKKRPKSIITTHVEYTWSRRSWKKNAKQNVDSR
jgi:hypothetical protein